MSAERMDPEVYGHVLAVMESVGEPSLSSLAGEIYTLASHSRSALFAVQQMAVRNLVQDVDVHILNLVETAYAGLTGRFEEIDECLDEYELRIRAQVAQLVTERLALKKALGILSVVMSSDEFEVIAKQVAEAGDVMARLSDTEMASTFSSMLVGLAGARGLEVECDSDQSGARFGLTSAAGRCHAEQANRKMHQMLAEAEKIGIAHQAALRPLGASARLEEATPLPAASTAGRKRKAA
jgi:hypothetical protein